MKRLLKALILLLALAALTACGTNEGATPEPIEGVKMTAKVTEVADRLSVDVIESEYAYGPYLVHIGDNAKIYGKSGNTISLSDVKVGDTVEITYSGQVMMSYPPQIVALRIVIK